MQIYKKISLFSLLPDEKIELLEKVIREKHYKRGAVIWEKCSANKELLIPISGKLKVVEQDEEGNELTLNFVFAGQWIGEMSLIDEGGHSATVVAIEDSNCLIIPRKDFLRLLEECPGLSINLIRLLIERVRLLSREISDLKFKDITRRVAAKLFFLFEKNARNEEILISHEELAGFVGATRENVTRALNQLAKRGTVTLSRKKILIKSAQELQSLL